MASGDSIQRSETKTCPHGCLGDWALLLPDFRLACVKASRFGHRRISEFFGTGFAGIGATVAAACSSAFVGKAACVAVNNAQASSRGRLAPPQTGVAGRVFIGMAHMNNAPVRQTWRAWYESRKTLCACPATWCGTQGLGCVRRGLPSALWASRALACRNTGVGFRRAS